MKIKDPNALKTKQLHALVNSECENGEKKISFELKISDEYHNYKYTQYMCESLNIKETWSNVFYKKKIVLDLLKTSDKTKNKKGFLHKINAADLNVKIKTFIPDSYDQEVYNERGVYKVATKGSVNGFDFGKFHKENNLIKFRNLCLGEIVYYDGKKKWEDAKLNEFQNLKKFIFENKLDNKKNLGKDLPLKKTDDFNTIMGEFQFANTSRFDSDMQRIFRTKNENDLDLLIYFTSSNYLTSFISGGTVNFKNSKDSSKKYNDIGTPVVIFGLDMSSIEII